MGEQNAETIPQTAQTEQDTAPWSQWTRRFVSVAAVITVVVGLSVAGQIYWQTLVALFIAVFLFSPIRVVMRRTGWSYGISTAVVFTLFIVILLGGILAFTAPVVGFVADLTTSVSQGLEAALVYLQDYTPGAAMVLDDNGQVVADLNFLVAPLSDIVQNITVDEIANVVPIFVGVLSAGFSLAGSLVGTAYNLFFINFVALLLLLEIPRVYRWLRNGLSSANQRQYGVLLQHFDQTWTSYMWGTAIVSLIGAALTWGLLTLLGIPDATGVTVVTTLVLLIPLFGPALGTVVAFLAALIGGSSVLTLSPVLVAIITGGLFFFLRGFVVGNFVYPRIVGKSVEVPAVIVMIALSFFGSIAGILGMFLSPILAAIVRDLVYFCSRKLNGKEPFPDEPMPGYMQSDVLKARHGTAPDFN